MIDLSKFCGEAGHGKYDLATPWACRGWWLYASDGALMVRVLTDLPDEEPVPIKRPEKAPKFFDPPIDATRPWPGVEAEVPGTKACYKCEEDDDDGFDSEDETKHCDVCVSDGIVADMDKMLNGFRFRGKYCRLIETLPNVKYEKGRVVDNSVRFTFDGGKSEGAIMNWPEDPKTYVRIAEICEPLRHAFDQIVSLKRGANKIVIQWTGFSDIPSMAHMCVAPVEVLTDMNFRKRRREDGMDVLDIVIQLAVQLGMEQGRRMERRFPCTEVVKLPEGVK